MDPAPRGQYVRYSDLAAARAEIERLTEELEHMTAVKDIHQRKRHDYFERAEKAEAERDEARAQVAMAYEVAAKVAIEEANDWNPHDPAGICGFKCGHAIVRKIRALTPAHAKAALEAYGREKVREGMKRAAEIIRGCCPECQGTGLRDSGGVQPWGEPIFVTCDCADAILAEMEKEAGE
jgi:hypothetical protein